MNDNNSALTLQKLWCTNSVRTDENAWQSLEITCISKLHPYISFMSSQYTAMDLTTKVIAPIKTNIGNNKSTTQILIHGELTCKYIFHASETWEDQR